jgi:glycosyltransferase involved in cell wall biosynthesis
MIKGEIKWGAYRKAEVFVLTSHTENFGIVVAEALACSTPVLISRRVNIWREIEGRKAGMTAEDTVSDSAEMLRNWIYAGREAKSAMRKQAQQTFNEIFEISNATKKIADELEKAARK